MATSLYDFAVLAAERTIDPDTRDGGRLAVDSRAVTCAPSVERMPFENVPTALPAPTPPVRNMSQI